MEKTVTGSRSGNYRRIHLQIVTFSFCLVTVISPLFAGSKIPFTPLEGTAPYSDTSGTFSPVPVPGPDD